MTRVAVALVAAGSLALWSAHATIVVAADPVPYDPGQALERPLLDVALVAAGRGGRPVELLTLDASVPDEGQVRIALLRRDEDWSVAAETTVAFASEEGSDSPWLVGIEPDRFAIVQPVEGKGDFANAFANRTAVAMVSVDRSVDPPALTVGEAVELALSVTASAAADVDGDKTIELLLAGKPDGYCLRVGIVLLPGDPVLWVVRRGSILLDGGAGSVRLSGAALGEWDGRPGADLLAHAFRTCAAPEDERHHLLALRLGDLSTIADIPSGDTGDRDPALDDSPAPIVVDVDRDGRSEAVVTLDQAISVIDPADDWRQRVIADGGAVTLGAFGQRPDASSTLLAWIGPARGALGSGIRTSRIARVDGSLDVVESSSQPFVDHLPSELDQLVAAQVASPYLGEFARPSGVGSAMSLSVDVDLDGCPDLVAPLLIAGCEGTAPPRVGPAFVGSRPLMLVGSTEDPRLLVAAARDWVPSIVAPTPSPALASPPGTWRTGSSVPFFLAEGRLQDVSAPSAQSAGTPVVSPMVSSDGRIELRAPTGSRLLVRALDRCDCKPRIGAPMADEIGSFLTVDPRGSELVTVLRIPTPAGTAPGAAAGRIDLDVREAFGLSELTPTRGFEVNVVALDVFGRPSRAVRVTSILDADPPAIDVVAPILSPPWPLEAGIVGTSEAGSSIRIGDEAAVEADGSGAFRLPVRLAPWPQDIELTAVDPSGNRSRTTISVMGGLDVRLLPWPGIMAIALLVAVLVSALRGSRRPPTVTVVEVVANEHSPELEDLGETRIDRRR